MKTILIPTDFSKNARNAISYALELTHKNPAKLILIHTFEIEHVFGIRISRKIEEKEEGLLQQLEVLVQNLKDSGKYEHIEFEIILHPGNLTYTLLSLIERNQIDLIVMGTKGQTDAHNRAFGSETAKIIHQTKIPVLAVPENARFDGIKHIFYSTDYRERDLDVIGNLVSMAKDFGAHIHIIHIESENNLNAQIRFRGFKDVLQEEFQYDKIVHELIINDHFLDGLASYVALHEKALLTMCYYKKTFFESLFSDSKAEDMAYISKVPLLVYHA